MTTTFPATDVIDVTQLQQLQLEDPAIRILDVRTGGEFENSHIPGSYNVPLDTLGEHVRDLADVEHPVVLVCQSGGRASQAHEKLTEAGKATLHILEGGMTSWQAAGGDLTVGNTTRWAMDRQVRFVAGTFAIVAVVASIFVPGLEWISRRRRWPRLLSGVKHLRYGSSAGQAPIQPHQRL